MLKREQRATLLLLSSNDESQTKMFPLPPRLYDKWWCGSSNEKGSLQGIFATKTSKGRKKGKQYCILDGEPLKKAVRTPKIANSTL